MTGPNKSPQDEKKDPRESNSPKLDIPEGIAPTGPVMNATEAVAQSILAVPVLLGELIEELEELNAHLSVLAFHAEKSGIKEGLFSEEDLEHEEDKDEQGAH